MKLTWFGGTTLRVHIGGSIVVLDAERAPAGVNQVELTGGAERLLSLGRGLDVVDGRSWRPRAAGRLLDAEDLVAVECWSLGAAALVIEAPGEAPLVVVAGPMPELGRWADRAVVVVLGDNGAGRAAELVGQVAPRLLALGLPDAELAQVFAELPARLDGTGLVALEPGLALEA